MIDRGGDSTYPEQHQHVSIGIMCVVANLPLTQDVVSYNGTTWRC